MQETFTFHVNMSSITLLHIEKYFGFIKNISEILKVTFPDKLNVCYVYNAPFIFSKLSAGGNKENLEISELSLLILSRHS